MSVFIHSTTSPNWNARPKGVKIDCIVLHADASPRIKQSLDWIRSRESKVSYHYLIGRLGDVYECVPPERRAWHAGISEFRGRRNVNDFSIGVSFGNRQDGELFTEAQYLKGAELVSELMERFPDITTDRITTHKTISPGRKSDPEGPHGSWFHMDYFLSLLRCR